MDEEGGEPIYGQAQGLRGERLPRQQVDRDVNPNLNHKNGPLFGLELTYKGHGAPYPFPTNHNRLGIPQKGRAQGTAPTIDHIFRDPGSRSDDVFSRLPPPVSGLLMVYSLSSILHLE
jgi:hypothetical protein